MYLLTARLARTLLESLEEDRCGAWTVSLKPNFT
jgi:hypothetical protein